MNEFNKTAGYKDNTKEISRISIHQEEKNHKRKLRK